MRDPRVKVKLRGRHDFCLSFPFSNRAAKQSNNILPQIPLPSKIPVAQSTIAHHDQGNGRELWAPSTVGQLVKGPEPGFHPWGDLRRDTNYMRKTETVQDISHCTPWWDVRQETSLCPVQDHPVNGILLFTLLSGNILFRLIIWSGLGSTGGGGRCSLILMGRSGSRSLGKLSSLLRAITLVLGTQHQVCWCCTTGRGQLVGRELGLLGEVQTNPGELREGRSRSERTEAEAFFWSAAALIASRLSLQDASSCFFFSFNPLEASFLVSQANFFSDATRALAAITDLRSLSCWVLVALDLGGAPFWVGRRAGGGKISFLVDSLRVEKSLPYSRLLEWMEGWGEGSLDMMAWAGGIWAGGFLWICFFGFGWRGSFVVVW